MVTLTRLFARYENALAFTADNVKYLRRLGCMLLAWVAEAPDEDFR